MTNSISSTGFSALYVPQSRELEDISKEGKVTPKPSSSVETIAEKLNPENMADIMAFGNKGAQVLNLANQQMDAQQSASKLLVELTGLMRSLKAAIFSSQLSEEEKQVVGNKVATFEQAALSMGTGVASLGANIKSARDFSVKNNALMKDKIENQNLINKYSEIAGGKSLAKPGYEENHKTVFSAMARKSALSNDKINIQVAELNAKFEVTKAKIQTASMTMNSVTQLIAGQLKHDADMHGLEAKKADQNKQDTSAIIDSLLSTSRQLDDNITNLMRIFTETIARFSGYKVS